MKITRKDFLRASGLAGAGLAFGPLSTYSKPLVAAASLPLGFASYTFRKLSLEQTIANAVRLGVKNIALKSMHMPLDAPAPEIQKIAKTVRDAGLDLYGAGVIYMKTQQEVETTFEYAKNAGLKMIIGVPNHELLPLVDKKVKEYDIKLAIHNHGPGDELYTSPSNVYEKIKDLDTRIGLCIDIGHVVRIKEDPSVWARKFKDRLYDVHLKDVNKAEADGSSVEVGRGVIDIPAFLKTMKKIGYNGTLSLEYEKDGDDPLPGAAESVGYIRGVLKMLS
jgi:sugar phosphate isomerase/epimerase